MSIQQGISSACLAERFREKSGNDLEFEDGGCIDMVNVSIPYPFSRYKIQTLRLPSQSCLPVACLINRMEDN